MAQIDLGKEFSHLIRVEGDCWVWRGKVNSAGRPTYWLTNRTRLAPHRIFWETRNKTKLGNFRLKAICGEPRCVNPDSNHNVKIADLKKPRQRRPHIRINNYDERLARAKEILSDWRTGKFKQHELAVKYSVSQASISGIVTRKAFSWEVL